MMTLTMTQMMTTSGSSPDRSLAWLPPIPSHLCCSLSKTGVRSQHGGVHRDAPVHVRTQHCLLMQAVERDCSMKTCTVYHILDTLADFLAVQLNISHVS